MGRGSSSTSGSNYPGRTWPGASITPVTRPGGAGGARVPGAAIPRLARPAGWSEGKESFLSSRVGRGDFRFHPREVLHPRSLPCFGFL